MAFKDFTPAQILTAQEVDTYLMRQAIMSFASSTARDVAITTPTEGMVAYLEDTNTFWFHNGSAWQNLGNVMRYASAAARASALPSPVEGMVSYVQDTDELQFYDGANWLTVVVTSDDEGFTTTGPITASNAGADGGITLRQWTASSAYQSLATTNMVTSEYVILSDGTDTFISGGVGGSVSIRSGNNTTTNQLNVNATSANFAGTVSIGPDGVVSANTSSQLHVRKDTAGGKGGEISIVNYATNTVGNSAALNFGVDASTYGSDSGNAQIRATNQVLSNAATELGFYTWNGSGWGRRSYIDSAGRSRFGEALGDQASGQLFGSSRLVFYTLERSATARSSFNSWTTMVSGVIDTSFHGVGYIWIWWGFSGYVNAGGSVQSRVLTQPSSGGSYAYQMNHYINEAYSHNSFTGASECYAASAGNSYIAFYLQVNGNGTTFQQDSNDTSWFVGYSK